MAVLPLNKLMTTLTSDTMKGFMNDDKGDGRYGELLIEVVGKAEADYYGNKQFTSFTLRDIDEAKNHRFIDLRY